MGILAKNVYSTKYITAEIEDSGKKLHFVPIKLTLGDFFLTIINKQVYAFRIEGSRILTWDRVAVKAFRKLNYSTAHYMPISAENNKELEDVLRKNNLPRVNRSLLNVFKHLTHKEKQPEQNGKFTAHQLKALVDQLAAKSADYPEQVKNMTNFLESLGTHQIVTPVKKITEFLEDDLKATDAKFVGTIANSLELMDKESKKVFNAEVTGKTSWVKLILILGSVGIVIALIAMLINNGTFTNMIPTFGSSTPQDIMSQYSSPEALKAAIDSGKIQYDSLPNDIKKLVDSVKPPS